MRFIIDNLAAMLLLFLDIAAIALVTGPAKAPTILRTGFGKPVDAIRDRSERPGIAPVMWASWSIPTNR